ncbi:MAG TPA: hypothetical protein QF373_08930 [Verrucomicrobiota bacterium]|nr:hypothetical protein [Verrucomicrobiota bacterium]
MKEARRYANRNGWTGLSDTGNNMIIWVIIRKEKWVHGITVIKKDRHSSALGLVKSGTCRPGNPAFPS